MCAALREPRVVFLLGAACLAWGAWSAGLVMLNAESVILAHYAVVSCGLTLPRSDATASSV
jgi:hypothetical protein